MAEKKEKKNFNFTIGLVDEFHQKCVPIGSNASVEIERLIRAEINRIDLKNEIIEYLFDKSKPTDLIKRMKEDPKAANLLDQFEAKMKGLRND
jgi:hypothetical protein